MYFDTVIADSLDGFGYVVYACGEGQAQVTFSMLAEGYSWNSYDFRFLQQFLREFFRIETGFGYVWEGVECSSGFLAGYYAGIVEARDENLASARVFVKHVGNAGLWASKGCDCGFLSR